LLLNLLHPFPRPLNIFVNVADFHDSDARPAADAAEKRSAERWPADDGLAQLRMFIFGVFELLVWMKKFKAQVKK
jgi:putative membrane protein